jgi:hypothetical protein
MLQPDTAPVSRSIWREVSQSTFIDRTKYLESQNVVGNLSTSDAPSSSTDVNLHDARYILPLASEQRLADDFAFLFAYKPGAGYVSATTIQLLDEGKPEVCVCLAANRGVTEVAGDEIRKFLGLIEQCARKGN